MVIKANIKDVARRAGVSVTSVSLVLNEKPNNISESTKQRIFEAAKELNYRPNYFARSLKTQESDMIGVLLPTLSNPFFGMYASHLSYYAKKQGYNILINEYNYEELNLQDALGNFLTLNVAGIIIIQFNIDDNMTSALDELKIPFVTADTLREDPENIYSTVIIDNYEGGVLATEHLINNGHTKIGCYTGPMSLASTQIRFQAYNDTLKKHNIEKGFYFEGTYNLGDEDEALEYFTQKGCTAIFSFNDMMALGLYKAARKRHIIIPKHLSIIGFDNIDISELTYPELTTIEQPLDDISAKAIKILLQNIEDNQCRKKIVIQPKLIERDSVLNITDL